MVREKKKYRLGITATAGLLTPFTSIRTEVIAKILGVSLSHLQANASAPKDAGSKYQDVKDLING